MVTPPPRRQHVVDCPLSRHAAANRRQEETPARQNVCPLVTAFGLLAAAVITGVVLMIVYIPGSGDPVYTVAITGVAGLDPARGVAVSAGEGGGDGPPLSPVFNLTFHVDNTRNSDRACVPGLSTAAVSYGDAVLANGTVPPFCAGKKSESERVAATARGDGVAAPQLLREQLARELAAGEAAVDVKVTMPRYWGEETCGDGVLSCKAKIGGGPSPPCHLDYVKTCRDKSEGDNPVMFWPPFYYYYLLHG